MKRKDEYSWLKDIDRGTTRQAVSNLDEAYRRFFNGLSSKPCYHLKRGHIQSFTTVRDNLKQKTAAIRVYNKSINLPKVGKLRTKVSRPILGNHNIRLVTITKTPTNKYYASITCLEPAPAYEKPRFNSVGIDLGIKTYATMSVNQKYQINIDQPL